jgi:hypothetical protein
MNIDRDFKAWSRANLERATMVMVAIAGCVFALVLLAYFIRFGPVSNWLFGPETPQQISDAKAAWGQLGDFFGGTLNPFLSSLTLVGLVFTILLQHESMARSQADNNKNIASLHEQSELSLITARLQALSVALDVITEMHAQAATAQSQSAIPLLEKKEKIANEILEINDALRSRPAI